MNEIKAQGRLSDNLRAGLSLALGMLVVLWRVFLPTNVTITVGIVILVAALDLVLLAALIILNKDELRAVFAKKITLKTVLITLLCYVLFFVGTIIWNNVVLIAGNLVTGEADIATLFGPYEAELWMPPQSPAAWVGLEFSRIFPIGFFISSVIAAPIWEEIAFRMAGKNLIKNKLLFVLVTTILFVFIHTGFAFETGGGYAYAGIAFAVIYLTTKDIRVAMGVHLLNNLLANIMLWI